MDDTFKQLGFTGPDGKPDEARMQEHILRRVWDLIKVKSSSTAQVAELRARATCFSALCAAFLPGGEEIVIGTPLDRRVAASCRG
jgi:hypothetical protein